MLPLHPLTRARLRILHSSTAKGDARCAAIFEQFCAAAHVRAEALIQKNDIEGAELHIAAAEKLSPNDARVNAALKKLAEIRIKK